MTTQEKLEKTLVELIAIPSTTQDSQACFEAIAYVRDQLTAHNLFIHASLEAANPWLIATTQDTKTPDILLAAHLDVVPAKQYKLEKRGDKFYGRGVYDMKIAAACYLEFLHTHADKLKELNIGVLFTTDEETGGHSTIDVLATGLRPKVVLIPDGGDNWQIEERAKGLYHTRLSVQGKASHGSRPWEGDNAVHRIMDTIAALRQLFPAGEKSDATLSVTTLNGGDAINQTPDLASATIDFRSFSKQDLARYDEEIARLAAENNMTTTTIQVSDPLILDKSAPAIQSFLATVKDFTGKDPVYSESYGGTDGRYFAVHGIPCLIMEPQGGGRHADEEWLLVEDLHRFYQLIEQWLLKSN